MRQASTQLSSTDLLRYQQFPREAERDRNRLVQALNGMHAEHVRYRGNNDHRVSHEDWRAQPKFAHVGTAGHEAPRTRFAVAVLAGWCWH